MAGEAARKGRSTQHWRDLLDRYSKRLLTPWGLSMGLTLLFFLVTFLVYYHIGPGGTYFRSHVYLANALMQGRLDIANWEELRYGWAVYEGKHYIIEPLMPALVLLPGVALYGVALNQALVSAVIGGLNAAAVHRLMRGLTKKLSLQVWLTVLFIFGTIYWWVASNGSTTQFTETLAVLFLFLAIYQTIVAKRPFLAGLFLGAAHLSRLVTVLGLPFFIIMFSDQWLPSSDTKSLAKRINLKPLVELGAGLGIFVALGMAYNYLAFETPLPASWHHWSSTVESEAVNALMARGVFDITYIPRHLDGLFKALPIVQSEAPYVLPSWAGMAFWVTTPAFLYAFFAGVKNKVAIRSLLAVLAITLTVILLSNNNKFDRAPGGLPIPFNLDLPYGIEYYPFALFILVGLFVGLQLRDKLILACWSAIIPIGLAVSTVFQRGWPSFGERFSLDYLPFLFLLTVRAMGDDLKWHHKVLIALSVIVNLWGVLWILQFNGNDFLGLEWVRW